MGKSNCIARNKLILLVETCTYNQIYGAIEQDLKYNLLFELLANITTKKFNSWHAVSNLDQGATHIFNIRYDTNVFNVLDAKNTIFYSNKSYDILSWHNVNEDDKEIIINCSVRGNTGIPDIQYNPQI